MTEKLPKVLEELMRDLLDAEQPSSDYRDPRGDPIVWQVDS